jgi:hypothetical protein
MKKYPTINFEAGMAGWTGIEPATSGLTGVSFKAHQSISSNINELEKRKKDEE